MAAGRAWPTVAATMPQAGIENPTVSERICSKLHGPKPKMAHADAWSALPVPTFAHLSRHPAGQVSTFSHLFLNSSNITRFKHRKGSIQADKHVFRKQNDGIYPGFAFPGVFVFQFNIFRKYFKLLIIST